jgi:pilus assembly protein CpaB
MNGRTLILLVVAIVIAVVTVIIVKNHSGGGADGPKVLIATNDISAGSFIHADKDIVWADWPQSSVSASDITPDSHHIEEFNGAVARYPITAGSPITTTSVVRATEGGFMSAVLTPGLRAVSIAVSATTGNAGFVFPGDKVDLLLTHKIISKDATDNVLASETFIENVRVLAIDQMLDNPENKAMVAKTITLEVSPKQAEMINVATSLGSISVSLRSLSTTNKVAAEQPDKSGKPADPVPAVATSTKSVPQAIAGDVQAPQINSNYSTDNDVSKLMGDKGAVHAKVSVFHGSTNEQLDFHEGSK